MTGPQTCPVRDMTGTQQVPYYEAVYHYRPEGKPQALGVDNGLQVIQVRAALKRVLSRT